MSDDLHPAIRDAIQEVRRVEAARKALDREWAAAHLSLRQLVGSDSRVGKLLGYSAAAGRQRVIKARRLLESRTSQDSD